MTPARRNGRPARIWLAAVAAVLVVGFTAVYRFNTLGGAFGGLDNDHFVSFAYAKQLQDGDRPLQQFDDMALQGAWPYPAYAISAYVQSAFGDSLRSEALLTIGGVALAAGLTLMAAALVAPLAFAILTTSFTVFVAPTLYNYPKVLMLSTATLGVVVYARAPSVSRAVALSVVTALAFVFRHDYAVYVGAGAAAGFAAAAPTWRVAGKHAAIYAALTCALLLPSLVYVERHVGIVTYFRDALQMSRSESQRTALAWPTFQWSSNGDPLTLSSVLQVEQNATAWLYYLILLLPLWAVLLIWRARNTGADPRTRAAVLALAAMLAVANPLLLRGNVAVRFGDVGPLYAVPLAAVLGLALRRSAGEPRWRRPMRIAILGGILVPTLVSVETLGFVRRQLETSALAESPRAARMRSAQLWTELGELPADYWTGSPPTDLIRAVQYLNRCTAPSDRVFMMPYVPELLPLADRRFAGGRASVLPGFLTTDRHQLLILERWSRQQVPVALVDDAAYEQSYARELPILDAYLNSRYRAAGTLATSEEMTLRVFVDRARRPSGYVEDTGLPCFGP